MENIDVLEQEIEAVLTSMPTAHWVALLDAAQVPGGPVYRYEQARAVARPALGGGIARHRVRRH